MAAALPLLPYPRLRSTLPGRRVCEPPPPPDPISEADLSLIWEGQRYPPGALSGPNGRPLRVLYPGRRGGGAGPDFRDAVIMFGEEQRIGDIELHVRASYYSQHGHHLDPAYEGLVLHVVFQDDAGGWSPLPSGRSVPVAAFAPWVSARTADIATWAEAPPLWTEPCTGAAKRLGEEAVSSAVAQAGRERLLARAGAIARLIASQGAGEALWQALMEALGYGGDRDGFRRLARALPAALLRHLLADTHDPAPQAWSALLAVGGLGGPDSDRRLPPPISPPLRRGGARPANQPQNRLASAAQLLVRARGDLPAFALTTVESATGARALLAAWSLHQGSAAGRGRLPGSLGAARATELLLNAVLPYAIAVRPALAERCLELAAALPLLPPYGKTAFLERNLARAGGKRRPSGALDQQGLLGLQAQWCSRGGCGRCPLS